MGRQVGCLRMKWGGISKDGRLSGLAFHVSRQVVAGHFFLGETIGRLQKEIVFQMGIPRGLFGSPSESSRN